MESPVFIVLVLGAAFGLLLVALPAAASASETVERFSPYYYPELYIEGYLTSFISKYLEPNRPRNQMVSSTLRQVKPSQSL